MRLKTNTIGIIGIIFGFLSIFLTLYIYHSKVNKKLQYLIERESGTLTYLQAKDLTDIYLAGIQTELRLAILEWVSELLPELVSRRDTQGARRQIYGVVDEVIATTRSKVASFRIVGGQSYKEFLDTVNPTTGSIIAHAKEQACAAVKAALETPVDSKNLESQLGLIAEDARRQSEEFIKRELQKRYSTD